MPRPPLMTQVHHFVSRVKKRQRWNVQTMWAYDLNLWPLGSPRLTVIRVLVLCQEYQVQISESDIPCDLVTLTFNLGGHGACRWCGFTSSFHIPTLKFLSLTVRKIWHILCVCVSRPVTLTFDLLTLKLVRNVARVLGYLPANFGDTTAIRFRFMGHWANTAQTDHVTLWPWPLTLAVADAVRRPPSVHQARRPCHSEDMANDVCQL